VDARGHSVDSGDDTGASGKNHPPTRYTSEVERRSTGVNQPAARTAAAGRHPEAAGRGGRPGEYESGDEQRSTAVEGGGCAGGSRLQQSEDAGADERGAGQGSTRL